MKGDGDDALLPPMENDDDIRNYFYKVIQDDPSLSATLAAIQTLLHYVRVMNVNTIMEMMSKIKQAIVVLMATDLSTISIKSGSELFLHFITLANLQTQSDYSECKKILLQRGELYVDVMKTARSKIAVKADEFIEDGSVILTHSKSRVVLEVLKKAAKRKRFTVYVTESLPDKSGHEAAEALREAGIPATIILDSSVGYIMERVSIVLLGAEGVVENGGIVNKIGTYTIAMCAQHLNKKVFVVAESFKFNRMFPLNQKDLHDEYKYHASTLRTTEDLTQEHPLVDYTPSKFIYLFVTDLGVHVPAAVSDKLISLYQ